MHTLARACLVTAIGLQLAGCGGGGGASAEALDLAGKNLLLVSIDTLRADHSSPYGYALETPALQRLADEGVVFEQAQSPVPLTQPAHTSLFTGLYPGRHGVRDNVSSALTGEALTMAEVLKDAGYQTCAVVGSKVLARQAGLGQGFDLYDDRFRSEDLAAATPTVERRAREVRVSAQQWLAARDRGRPFALFVHFYDVHLPHDPPPRFKARHPERPIDGEIEFVDRNIQELLSTLERDGALDDTLIVVFSDHGESLGEHDEMEHGLFLYEATSHVPLIFRLPGAGAPRGMRVATPVSLVDVLPTVLELLRLPAPEVDGLSLVPLLAGGELPPRPLLGETHYPLCYRWAPSYSLRDEGWKYILAPEPELYDLKRDPDELENLVERQEQRAAGMRAALEHRIDGWKASANTVEAASGLSLQELAALGYGGSAPVDEEQAAGLPDAKRRTKLYQQLIDALDLMAVDRLDEARAALVAVLEQEPTNNAALLNMGSVLSRMGRHLEAEQHLKACLALQPDSLHAKRILATGYLLQQRLDEAEALLREILEVTPEAAEPRFYLGQVLAMRGDFAGALECFEAAQRLQPDIPLLEESLAGARRQVELQGGR